MPSDNKPVAVQPYGDLAKPASLLIEKMFGPGYIRKKAKAEADAAKTKAESEIEIFSLRHEAFRRFADNEVARFVNVEEIAIAAAKLLNDSARPQDISEDWVRHFWQKAANYSEAEARERWVALLAAESNSPGSICPRTVDVLASMDSSDAREFAAVCRFACRFPHQFGPVIFNPDDEIYHHQMIGYDQLVNLMSLGLLQFETGGLTKFVYKSVLDEVIVEYGGRSMRISCGPKGEVTIGRVILTRAGRELLRLEPPDPVNGFYEYLQAKWAKRLLPEPEEGKGEGPAPAMDPAE